MMIALGAINLFRSWSANKRQRKFQSEGVQTTGKIISLKEISSGADDSPVFVPGVRFSTAFQEDIEFTSQQRCYAGNLLIGQEVTVYCLPNSAQEAEVLLIGAARSNIVIGNLLCAIMVLVGLVMLCLQLLGLL